MSKLMTFRVSFCVLDCYSIYLGARDPDSANQKAHLLYERRGEEPFPFTSRKAEPDNWDTEEVVS